MPPPSKRKRGDSSSSSRNEKQVPCAKISRKGDAKPAVVHHQKEKRGEKKPFETAVDLAGRYSFETDYADHFETPRAAYGDIAPLLGKVGDVGKLRVYDPYYCEGTAETHLKALGFSTASNPRDEDFYETPVYRAHAGCEPPPEAAAPQTAMTAAQKKKRKEREKKRRNAAKRSFLDKVHFDAFVTNPPYSGEHKERALSFAMASQRPWCLLLPAYVAEKAYFARIADRHGARPFFIVPGSRYDFAHPHGAGHDHSHFESVWFVDGGSPKRTEELYAACKSLPHYARGTALRRDVAELRAAKTLRSVASAKRPNPRMRKKLNKKKNAAAPA